MRSQNRASSSSSSSWTYDKNENNKQKEDYYDKFNIKKIRINGRGKKIFMIAHNIQNHILIFSIEGSDMNNQTKKNKWSQSTSKHSSLIKIIKRKITVDGQN